jgi:hypothetical protein
MKSLFLRPYTREPSFNSSSASGTRALSDRGLTKFVRAPRKRRQCRLACFNSTGTWYNLTGRNCGRAPASTKVSRLGYLARTSAICWSGSPSVIGRKQRTTICLLPAILVIQSCNRRILARLRGEGVAKALNTFIIIGRPCASGLNANDAAFRLLLHNKPGDIDPDLVIVRPDVGGAQPDILR